MNLKTKISELVTNFKNENAWDRSEEHIQTMFTVKLLDLLGFNSSNMRINQGQEVKTGKKPDILLFNNSGNTILVIESKDASKIEMLDGRYQNKTFIEQLAGYCNAEGIVWGILTNFVEWRIYSIYQNRLYKDKKYAFHEILWHGANKNNYVDLLSEDGLNFFETITNNSLVNSKGRIDDDPVYYPQQEEIKEQFFQDLKRWRSDIRSYINKHYSNKYNLDIIDLMTQKILDRLIFIDYCADNNIITQDRLHAILHSKGNLHNELTKIFKDMDEKFNSELFALNECDQITIDDEIIRPVITELSNTDFSKLSVHVIGEVYENYLGELLKAGKRGVKVEESKLVEKKKSQGIYYTPDYIVNYIVVNTVGVILKKCKKIEEIEKIRVLDPACGSGSFLIRVFDEFLKHYERIDPSGLFHFDVRKKILQNNIYGVDLDERAVEIAKLNLLVKALEGSAHASLSGRKILPNLKLNIRCGNSLISGEGIKDKAGLFQQAYGDDISVLKKYHQEFNNEQDEIRQAKIYKEIEIQEYTTNQKVNQGLELFFKNPDINKPFNYSISFPGVLENGGFDCIIGNPPYVFARGGSFSQEEKKYYSNFSLSNYQLNTYLLFTDKSFNLLNDKGFFGFIMPNTWLTISSFDKLRKFILSNTNNLQIINIHDKVFQDANVDTCLLIFKKGKPNDVLLGEFVNGNLDKVGSFKSNKFLGNNSVINISISKNNDKIQIIDKINSSSKYLKEFAIVSTGLKAYQTGKGKPKQTDSIKNNRVFHSDKKKDETYKKYLEGRDVCRYYLGWSGEYLSYGEWLAEPRQSVPFANKRILVRQIPSHPPYSINAVFTDKEFYNDINSMVIFNFEIDPYYLLSILNSKLITFWFINSFDKLQRGLFPQFKVKELQLFPIKTGSDNDIATLVKDTKSIIDLYKLYHNSKHDDKVNIQIESLNRKIDNLIYKIYKLTSDEIKIIEDSQLK